MRRLFQLFSAMTRWERWVLAVLVALFVLSTGVLLRQFYSANTIVVPTVGGTYIEGSVGSLQPLNPWFTVQNDVNRDIVSLVFAGLLKYNPQTKQIEDDLAELQKSEDDHTYTLRLKDGILWHDSTSAEPHPVTADDVMFTFETIQDPQFPNTLLQQNFRGVHVTKIDDRTVQFSLDEVYGFFPSNLTIGLLPKKSFTDIPVSKIDQELDFAYHPIGAGPYKVKSIVQTDLSSEVTLERFARTLEPTFRLDRIVFRIFSDYSTLLSDLHNLQGVRLVPRNDNGDPIIPKGFVARQYYLPQYVAIFFNLDRKNLQDQQLRLGLQLGTDKKAIVDGIHESVIVDTPLLELNTADWQYHFDMDNAQGSLFESRWHLPERIRLQRLLEEREANQAGVLHLPPVVLLETGAALTLTGSLADAPMGSKVNSLPIVNLPAQSGAWITALPTVARGTGSLKPGDNVIRLTGPDGKTVDTFYLRRTLSNAEYARALEEQRVMQLYVRSRANQVAAEKKINIQDLFLEDGMLRLRYSTDPFSVRRNDAGQPLTIRLLTSPAPEAYRKVAESLRDQWVQLGVQMTVDIPATQEEFQDRLLRRDYDVLLFGQSLLDNLDSFPYWHSSGVQKLTGNQQDLRLDAYNLSQYSSFEADSLLETVRKTADEKERLQALQGLREVLKKDVPAIFLYSPLYTFAIRNEVFGIDLGSLSLHSDRFLTLYRWYVKEERIFKPGKGWFSFFGWLPTMFSSAEPD